MRVNRYNAEHYIDITAYEALRAIERDVKKRDLFRPMIYVCSPFAGDVEANVQRAKTFCRFAVEHDAIPIAPHLYFPRFMDDKDQTERNLGLFFGMVLLAKCRELWCFGERISSGMKIELEKAKRLDIPIRYFSNDLQEVKPCCKH